MRHNPPSLGVLGSFSCALLALRGAFLFQLQLLISKLPDGSRFLRATVLSAGDRRLGRSPLERRGVGNGQPTPAHSASCCKARGLSHGASVYRVNTASGVVLNSGLIFNRQTSMLIMQAAGFLIIFLTEPPGFIRR